MMSSARGKEKESLIVESTQRRACNFLWPPEPQREGLSTFAASICWPHLPQASIVIISRLLRQIRIKAKLIFGHRDVPSLSSSKLLPNFSTSKVLPAVSIPTEPGLIPNGRPLPNGLYHMPNGLPVPNARPLLNGFDLPDGLLPMPAMGLPFPVPNGHRKAHELVHRAKISVRATGCCTTVSTSLDTNLLESRPQPPGARRMKKLASSMLWFRDLVFTDIDHQDSKLPKRVAGVPAAERKGRTFQKGNRLRLSCQCKPSRSYAES